MSFNRRSRAKMEKQLRTGLFGSGRITDTRPYMQFGKSVPLLDITCSNKRIKTYYGDFSAVNHTAGSCVGRPRAAEEFAIDKAGWHWSYFKDPESIAVKYQSVAYAKKGHPWDLPGYHYRYAMACRSPEHPNWRFDYVHPLRASDVSAYVLRNPCRMRAFYRYSRQPDAPFFDNDWTLYASDPAYRQQHANIPGAPLSRPTRSGAGVGAGGPDTMAAMAAAANAGRHQAELRQQERISALRRELEVAKAGECVEITQCASLFAPPHIMCALFALCVYAELHMSKAAPTRPLPHVTHPNVANLSSCRSRCADCDTAITALGDRPLRPHRPRFYLHDSGGFNFSAVLRGVSEVLAGRPPDVVWPVGEGQYLIEPPLLHALAASPHRTRDPDQAAIHVLSVAPWASMLLAARRGEPAAHAVRMQRAAETLRTNVHFIRSRGVRGKSQPGPVFVQLLGGESLDPLGIAYQRLLAGGNVLLGCTDPTNAAVGGNSKYPAHKLMATAVTLPYFSHAYALQAHPAALPRSGLMFHGGFGRFDFGNRDRMHKMLLRVRSLAPDVPVNS